MSAERIDPVRPCPGTRQKILDAAEHLIALRGPEGFRLKEVAAAVGIRPPSVYAHFDGRDDIAREVETRLYERIYAELDMGRALEGDPWDSLLRMTERFVRYLAVSPAHLRLVLRDLSRTAFPMPEDPAEDARASSPLTLTLNALLRRGMDEGLFRRQRVASVSAQIVGACLVNLSWKGWDEEGEPVLVVPLDEIERESLEMVRRLLTV